MESKKKLKLDKNEFIDDEAELSGDDEVSEDEDDLSEDGDLEELVDREAKELDADEEEAIRVLYHKQQENEDRRAVHLLREQFEENAVGAGLGRRRKFRWQTRELIENSLGRHYDPDDDDSQDDDDDDFVDDFSNLKPRLRRPNAEALLIGSTKIVTETLTDSRSSPIPSTSNEHPVPSSRVPASAATVTQDLNRFVFRDKQLVEALSTRETVITTREEKDRVIQREIKRVLQSKSIFDQLYS